MRSAFRIPLWITDHLPCHIHYTLKARRETVRLCQGLQGGVRSEEKNKQISINMLTEGRVHSEEK